jgi:hypothetical protein
MKLGSVICISQNKEKMNEKEIYFGVPAHYQGFEYYLYNQVGETFHFIRNASCLPFSTNFNPYPTL